MALILTSVIAESCWAQQRPPLLSPRVGAISIPLGDSRVFVTGGFSSSAGISDPNTTIEIYDYRTGSTLRPSFISPVFSAVLLNPNQILACGSACGVYSLTTNSWLRVADRSPTADSDLVLLKENAVFAAGGAVASGSTNEAAIFEAGGGLWRSTSAMTELRAFPGLIRLLDGHVLAVGGLKFQFRTPPLSLRSVESFDPVTEQWSPRANTNVVSGDTSASLGGLQLLALADGRILAMDGRGAELYDPRADNWRSLGGVIAPRYSTATLLPSGDVLIAGGEPLNRATVFNPDTGEIRNSVPLRVPRTWHSAVQTADGIVLLLGGLDANGKSITRVESFAWEPRLGRSLEPGFYVVSATQGPTGADGFWGIEVHSSGPLDGGLNFGGLLAAGGKEVGFGAFYIAEPQTVSARVNLQALPGTTGPLEVTLNVLDVNKKLVAGPIQGLGNLSWSQALQPGFYVLELRSSERAPPASFQMAVSAPQLQAGGSAGASLQASAGVTGFVGFYLASKQDVTINLYNEQTYGYPRGAGEVILTLYDAAGKVLQRVGPGATPP